MRANFVQMTNAAENVGSIGTRSVLGDSKNASKISIALISSAEYPKSKVKRYERAS